MKKIFIGMSILYFAASIINLTTAIFAPSVYKVWADSAFISLYKSLMESFSISTVAITIVMVAIYQFIMAFCFFKGSGRYIFVGLLMSIVFHTVIIPWGLWSLPNIVFVLLSSSLLYKVIQNDKHIA